MAMTKKKYQHKETKGEAIRKDEKRNAVYEDQKVLLGKKKVRDDMLDEENRLMMMNLTGMDASTKKS